MFKIDSSYHYIRVIFSDLVDEHELVYAVKAVAALPEYPEKNDIWVFDGCTFNFSHSKISSLIQIIDSVYPPSPSRTKTALLTDSELHYAFFKIVCEEAESLPYSMRAFTQLSEADAWLNEK
jgi:hypothetical protein